LDRARIAERLAPLVNLLRFQLLLTLERLKKEAADASTARDEADDKQGGVPAVVKRLSVPAPLIEQV